MSALGDQVRVQVAVRIGRERAFALFTGAIDQWWRKGRRFRQAGGSPGSIHLEAGIGGRFYERWVEGEAERHFEIGEVTRWEPPARLAFTWRNSVFAVDEITHVEIDFVERDGVTTVTVVHRGWSGIRPDHPARHGEPDAVFQRQMGQWWGDQAMSFRLLANLLR